MENCVFCQIVKGKIPCYKVYEDDNFLGFLDVHPRTKGHTIFIPKKHFRWIYDIPNFSQCWETVLKVTKAMQKTLDPVFVSYITHGLEIEHAHIHIMPRTGETDFVPEEIVITPDKMKRIAEIIFQEVKNSKKS